jgi:hypothetical protein
LLAAQALLEAYPPQLAGGEDDVAVLKPEYASKESAVPIATQASDPIRAAWHYAEEWLRGGHVPFSVCIATASTAAFSTESILEQKPESVDADVLTGDYLLKPNRVVVADISAVKGFEFSLILICGLDDGDFPPSGVPAAEHWREALRLYVAITRGRDEVRFIYQNAQSPFLTAMTDKIQFQTWEAPPLPEPVIEPVTETVIEPIIEPVVEPVIAPAIDPLEERVVAQAVEPVVARPVEPAIQPALQPVVTPIAERPAQSVAPRAAGQGPQVAAGSVAATLPSVPAVPPSSVPVVADGFFDQHEPEVLNGYLVIPIPQGADQWELARAVGRSQTAISIVCQQLGHFTRPNTALPLHIIRGVCDYFRCVPNVISSARKNSRSESVRRPEHYRR